MRGLYAIKNDTKHLLSFLSVMDSIQEDVPLDLFWDMIFEFPNGLPGHSAKLLKPPSSNMENL